MASGSRSSRIQLAPFLRWFALLLVLSASGCAGHGLIHRQSLTAAGVHDSSASATPQCAHRIAECAYQRAIRLERQADPACLNAFALCALQLWQKIDTGTATASDESLYRSCVGQLVLAAERLNRFDPEVGIELQPIASAEFPSEFPSDARSILPVHFVGFPWQAGELRCFQLPGKYHSDLETKCSCGIGVPLIGFPQSRQPFVSRQLPIPATAVVRESASGAPVLEIINPQVVRKLSTSSSGCRALAFDLTSPLALRTSQYKRDWLTGLLRPDDSVKTERGLRMSHPYRPGMIPVIFVHGLASGPITWASMYNELQTHPHIFQDFQFWTYTYPTGEPFPLQAAKLREELLELRQSIDPSHSDGALDQIVVIGHSMGGLVAKLQVMCSGERLVHAVADTPQELAEMPENIRQALHWTPSSQISRVVFIATPHQGSALASRPVGRLASRLIQMDGTVTEGVEGFVTDTRSLLTRSSRDIPTSIDLLRPSDPLLRAIYCSPVSTDVHLHTIAGVGNCCLLQPVGDGVVSLASAHLDNVDSELQVDAGHDAHQHPATIREVLRILDEHQRSCAAVSAAWPTNEWPTNEWANDESSHAASRVQ